MEGGPEADAVIAGAARVEGGCLVPGDLVRQVAAHLRLPVGAASHLRSTSTFRRPRPRPSIAPNPVLMEQGAALFCRVLPRDRLHGCSAGRCPSYASPRGGRPLVPDGPAGLRNGAPGRGDRADAARHDDRQRARSGTGAGYDDVRRIRLMHAAVRYFIEHDPSVPHTTSSPHTGPRMVQRVGDSP